MREQVIKLRYQRPPVPTECLGHTILDLFSIVHRGSECRGQQIQVEGPDIQTVFGESNIAHERSDLRVVRYGDDGFVQHMGEDDSMKSARNDVIHRGHLG
jgi:hypothetical protein